MSVDTNLALLKAAIFTPGSRGWGLPLLFWGEPGIGKSDVIEEFGALYGMHVEVLSPGERGEGAFGVTPIPIGEGRNTRIIYPRPDWLDFFEDSDGGIVFVDEITTAPPALQSALLGLVQARRIGSHKLAPRIRVIGAGNPPDIAAGGWELASPTANRFGHPEFGKPSSEEWRDWAMSYDPTAPRKKAPFSAEAEEARVLSLWGPAFAQAKGLVCGFIHARPELLHKRPPAGDPNASRAWPSHRMWDIAMRAIASSQIQGLSESHSDLLLTSFIGLGAMTEFVQYRTKADLPDPTQVLDKKIKWHHDPMRLDHTMAVLSACVAVVCDERCENRTARVEQLWKMLAEVMTDAQDLVVLVLKPLIKARLHTTKAALGPLTKLKPIIDAAGWGG